MSAVRPARPGDVPALVELEIACFDPPWSAMFMALEVDNPPSVVVVAEEPDPGSDELTGYAALRAVADEAELLRLGVRPDLRGRGLGDQLLRAGLKLVRQRGALRCFLEVRTHNRPAIALYGRLGFETVGRRKRYYADGSDALVMVLDLERSG